MIVIKGTSHMNVWRALKNSEFKAYKMTVHQKLHDGDQANRKDFCEQLLHTYQTNPSFSKTVLWTDEKLFCLTDCFNRQNFRYSHISYFKIRFSSSIFSHS